MLAVAESGAADSAEWDAIWAGSPYATYFHSREWYEVWAAYTGGKFQPRPRRVRFTDGTVAVLPIGVHRARFGILDRHVTSPAGTYGGWLSVTPLADEHRAILHGMLANGFPNAVWRTNPYDDPERWSGYADLRVKHDSTHAVDLAVIGEKLTREWTKGHASAAKKAIREGVTIRTAVSVDDWVAYYGLYLQSLERWGEKATSKYDWRLFETLAALTSPHVRLWLAEARDEIIAGALCFYSGHHVAYWHGSAADRHFELRPVHLLMHAAISDARQRGCRWFDFNPSGGHEGVRAFKKGFGTAELACPVLYIQTSRDKVLRDGARWLRGWGRGE